MTSQEFHLAKEAHVKAINKIIQTVKTYGEFRKETKEKVIEFGERAADVIFMQRKHIYEVLNGFDFQQEYDHEDAYFTRESIFDLKKDAHPKVLNHAILQSMSEVLTATAKNPIDSNILDTETNNKYIIGKDFEESNGYIKHCFEQITEALQAEDAADEKEEDIIPPTPPVEEPKVEILKHKLTEEDFDNNPDLNKLGFNLGDEIEIESPLLQALKDAAVEFNAEAPDSTVAPTAPAVTPIEEIEKQNATEKKQPRKRARKN